MWGNLVGGWRSLGPSPRSLCAELLISQDLQAFAPPNADHDRTGHHQIPHMSHACFYAAFHFGAVSRAEKRSDNSTHVDLIFTADLT